MTEPTNFPVPAASVPEPPPSPGGVWRLVGAAVAVIAGTVLLGVAAGFGWAAIAPRPELVMTATGAAAVANAETSAFIVADAAFCMISVVGGVLSGLAGYLFAVRRHGPVPMAGVMLGAVAAAFAARWVGEQSGLAAFHHLLATLPAGARLRGSLTLSAGSGLAFWPLAAGVTAGALEAFTFSGRRQERAGSNGWQFLMGNGQRPQ